MQAVNFDQRDTSAATFPARDRGSTERMIADSASIVGASRVDWMSDSWESRQSSN
jgi:hypothetical protein